MHPDKEFIRKWVDALRSGNYNQCKHQLRTNTKEGKSSFCCLGVACDVYDARLWRGMCYDNEVFSLPGYLLSKLNNDEDRILANMNDLDDKNFNDIAAYLEKTYLE